MSTVLAGLHVSDGEMVRVEQMAAALTAGTLAFGDGATQVFTVDGHTTYTSGGRSSEGEWVAEAHGQFASFWPPNYRASYALSWRVHDGAIVGLTFEDIERGSRFDGRFV